MIRGVSIHSVLLHNSQVIFKKLSTKDATPYLPLKPNGPFTVYRLLKVSLTSLLEMKGKANGGGLESPRVRETLKRLKALGQSQRLQNLQVEPRERAIATQSKELEDRIKWKSTMACKYENRKFNQEG